MLFQKTTWFWIITTVVIGALTYVLSGILFPFVLGFILAYVLNPLVAKLEKHRFNRTWATVTVICGLLLTVLSAILVLIPVLEAQAVSFIVKVPTLANTLWTRLQPVFDMAKEHISEQQLTYIKEALSSQTSELMNEAGTALMGIFTGWSALFNIASFLVITPVVAFYLLADWKIITAKIKDLIPRQNMDFIMTKIRETDTILSAFIRGQASVCLFLALFYGLG